MSTTISPALIDGPTLDFLKQHGALGGYIAVARVGDTIDLVLSDGAKVIDNLPASVRSSLVLAAARTDGVMSKVYEFLPDDGSNRTDPPRRSQFPDTVDGGRAYARALGEFHAANREAHEKAGLPPDGRPTMSRASFEALDPLAKRQAVRDKVKLFD